MSRELDDIDGLSDCDLDEAEADAPGCVIAPDAAAEPEERSVVADSVDDPAPLGDWALMMAVERPARINAGAQQRAARRKTGD
jgi:hypothetical protein